MEDDEIIKIALDKMRQTSSEELAIRKANQIESLEIDDEGKVLKNEGDLKETLESLAEKYEEIMGDVALNLIAADFKKKDVDKERLPQVFQKRY